ncbi:MAG: hypothetical protein JNK11_00505 [Alphaproteobacteria bacterium]|nr:hypothetical protein [Alphaproteobacteria bacterium]
MRWHLAVAALALAACAAGIGAGEAAAQQRNPRAAAVQMRSLLDGSPQGTVRIEAPRKQDAQPGEISVPLKSGGTVEEKFRAIRNTELLVSALAEKADELKSEARIAADYCAVAFWRIKVEIEVNGYNRTPMAVIERARATCESARDLAQRREAVAAVPAEAAPRPGEPAGALAAAPAAGLANATAAAKPGKAAQLVAARGAAPAAAAPQPAPPPMVVADAPAAAPAPAAPAAAPEAPVAPLDDSLQGH